MERDRAVRVVIGSILSCLTLGAWGLTAEAPIFEGELIFPLERWHNHSSCIVEQPNGDLLVCWYHGSGERQADDVVILGARKKKGSAGWSQPFLMEDIPGFPDANPAMFIDPHERLWLVWPTILANEWHTALLKYRVSSDYLKPGPPSWEVSRDIHLKPGEKFQKTVEEALSRMEAEGALGGEDSERRRRVLEETRSHAADKYFRRMGWMPRAHPFVLDGRRLILPLYSDGFSFSLMAITDDWGKTWETSTPLVGIGSIQPTIAQRRDGSLVAYMRDNGPPPKRLHVSESSDRGETWSRVVDSDLPNPGAGAEVLTLRNGHWMLIYNDLERGRYSLAVALSDNEGKSWKWKRHLELDQDLSDPANLGSYHYPSIIEARDGSFHASYSYFLPANRAEKDSEGRALAKSIKHVRFNAAWIREGDPQ